MRKNLTRKEKLKSVIEIKRIFSFKSSRVRYHGAQLRFVENGLDHNRFMICLVRKFGNAIERNSAKRILREIYRHQKNDIKKGFDLAFILLPGDYDYKERKKQFEKLIKKAELFFETE